MNLSQLYSLFDHIPDEMSEILGKREFQACWYGCAELDHRFVEAVNREDGYGSIKPKVFFYTDPAYERCFREQHPRDFIYCVDDSKNPWTYLDKLTFTPTLGEVRSAWIYSYDRSSHGIQYIILINCPNQLLEISLIQKGIAVELVCERASYGGGRNGPFLLGNLGAIWSLGQVSESFDEREVWYLKNYLRETGECYDLPEITGLPFFSINHNNNLLFGGKWYPDGYLPLRKIYQLNHSSLEELKDMTSSLRKCLSALLTINLDTVRCLCKFKKISLDSLSTITPSIAEAFSNHTGVLQLDAVQELSEEAVRALSAHKGELSLRGLRILPVEAAKALMDHTGKLILSPLLQLCDESASMLSRHKGLLVLKRDKKYDLPLFSKLGDPQARLLRRVFETCVIRIQDSWHIQPEAIPVLAAHPEGLILSDSIRKRFDGFDFRDRSAEFSIGK